MSAPTLKDVKRIASYFIERSNALDLKGVKRDDAALNFFLGAATGAYVCCNYPLGDHLNIVSAMVITTRGFKGVKSLLDLKEEE